MYQGVESLLHTISYVALPPSEFGQSECPRSWRKNVRSTELDQGLGNPPMLRKAIGKCPSRVQLCLNTRLTATRGADGEAICTVRWRPAT